MSLEISLLLIVVAGAGGYCLGRFLGKPSSYTKSVGLYCYDCETKTAHVDVSSGPEFLVAYGWDNTNGATPTTMPPAGSVIVEDPNGRVVIPDIPHQNNATKILLQIWGLDMIINTAIDCDNNSWACPSSSSGSSSETEHHASVLP